MSSSDPSPRDWLDRFFASYYARRPVSATFIGVHGHDGLLPDLSETGVGDALADVEALLDAAPATERTGEDLRPLAANPEELDVRLATGFLRIARWETRSGHVHARNPSHYTGEAVFGLMALFLSGSRTIPERVEAAVERMRAIPALLAQGRSNVRAAPREWTARAVRECDGGVALFSEGIAALAAERGIGDARFLGAGAVAARAFAEHKAYLERELRDGSDGTGAACGEEALDLHLREGHFLEESPDELVRYAEDVIAEASSRLDRDATALGASSPAEALARLSDHHPGPDEYPACYGAVWERMRALAVDRALVTWPDFPIRYVARPEWTRAAAPHLYFLNYRSPPAFGRPPVHDYLVTPIEPSMPAGERDRLLRGHDDSVIKLNHVIHHGGLGHHVQNWHAFRAPSRVGRIAAVDCASRIAMLCGGTMAEGWACYATDLMGEVGALTPLEALSERRGRIRMAARAVVDVRLHQGRLTPEDAVSYYRRTAGMSEAAARSEVVKNGMFPGGAVMYLTGTDAIHRLRRDVEALQGSAFSLRSFHDRFLAHGSIPVSLIADKMRWEVGADGL